MTYQQLLRKLWWLYNTENPRTFSFEQSLAIIQIAREDGQYEDKNVRVTVKNISGKEVFSCDWKKY